MRCGGCGSRRGKRDRGSNRRSRPLGPIRPTLRRRPHQMPIRVERRKMGIGEERGNERNEFRFSPPRRCCVKRWMTGTFYTCVLLLSLSPLSRLSRLSLFLACLVFLPHSGLLGHSVYSIRWPTCELIYRQGWIKRQAQHCSGRPQDLLNRL